MANGKQATSLPYTRKWEWTSPGPARIREPGQFNDIAYLRMAETLLLQAEAQMKLGKLEEAAESLNKVKRRSNATEVSASEVTIDFITVGLH